MRFFVVLAVVFVQVIIRICLLIAFWFILRFLLFLLSFLRVLRREIVHLTDYARHHQVVTEKRIKAETHSIKTGPETANCSQQSSNIVVRSCISNEVVVFSKPVLHEDLSVLSLVNFIETASDSH